VSIRSLTQEDPIGLAGGLNLYGFANGDPVNFSDPFGFVADTIDYDSPETKAKVEAAAALSPTLGETLEDIQLDPSFLLHIRQGPLSRLDLNPGVMVPQGTNVYGQRVASLTFAFGLLPLVNEALQKKGLISEGGAVQESDVIGHEIYGHVQPYHEFGRCSDLSGCARNRENIIRKEMGHKPRTDY
jgi:uncharacterized protein RhaS with RHS repeats